MNAEAIIQDLTTRGVRVWAEADKLKLDAPVGILTDEDKAKLVAAKPELLAALSRPGVCPKCRQGMNLQDRSGDAWFCPSCRLFADSKGQPLPPVIKKRSACREQVEARKLLADLQAAGCGVSWDGDELRITNLTKIPTALWMRLEAADSEFLKIAREMAETIESEEAGKWIN